MKNKLFKGIIIGLAVLLIGGAVINGEEPLPLGTMAMTEIQPLGAEPLPLGAEPLPLGAEPLPLGAIA